MSHMQYMLRSGWNWYVSGISDCFETSVVRRPRGMVGTEEYLVTYLRYDYKA